ncbi:MAG: sigma factor [Candidatus Wallbacteria bacterium]|nr:sigma factor [Candidatus Wallbacteria bacterium]
MIETIYLTHRHSLYRFALSLTRDKELSQDLVSDTILTALRHMDLLATFPEQRLKS